MFGTITTNPKALSDEENARYRALYCGLCQQLEVQFGNIGPLTLTYDMTFLAMLHGSLYSLEEAEGRRRCIPHPVSKHPYAVSKATAYAADMNLFLAYYQCLDDWNDEKLLAAREKAKRMEEFLPAIRTRLPRQCAAIEDGLAELSEMERTGELNPDLPANCFGRILGEVFAPAEDEYADTLRRMGAALGRYVYLLDAVNDLKSDIKHERYNPLVAQMDTDFLPMLQLMMGECTTEFEKLPIERDLHILQNVLYSGVWQNYKVRKEGGEPADGGPL